LISGKTKLKISPNLEVGAANEKVWIQAKKMKVNCGCMADRKRYENRLPAPVVGLSVNG
jgi:hypothetical protein